MAWELRFFGPATADPGVVKMTSKNRGDVRTDHYFLPLPLPRPELVDFSGQNIVEYLEEGLVIFPVGIKMRGNELVDPKLNSFEIEVKHRPVKRKTRGAEYWTKFYPPTIPFTHSSSLKQPFSLHERLCSLADEHSENPASPAPSAANKNLHLEAIKKSRGIVSVLVKKEIFTKNEKVEEKRVLVEQTKISVTVLNEAGNRATKEYYSISFEIKAKDPKEKRMATCVYKVCEDLFPASERKRLGFALDSYPSFLFKLACPQEHAVEDPKEADSSSDG